MCLHSKGHWYSLCLAGLECSARCLLGIFDHFPAANQGSTYWKHSLSTLTALIAFQLSFLPLLRARSHDCCTKEFCHLWFVSNKRGWRSWWHIAEILSFWPFFTLVKILSHRAEYAALCEITVNFSEWSRLVSSIGSSKACIQLHNKAGELWTLEDSRLLLHIDFTCKVYI